MRRTLLCFRLALVFSFFLFFLFITSRARSIEFFFLSRGAQVIRRVIEMERPRWIVELRNFYRPVMYGSYSWCVILLFFSRGRIVLPVYFVIHEVNKSHFVFTMSQRGWRTASDADGQAKWTRFSAVVKDGMSALLCTLCVIVWRAFNVPRE